MAVYLVFSDKAFDTLLTNFQKGMAQQNLAKALDYAWKSVMDDLAKTQVDSSLLPIVLFLLFFYGIFFTSILLGIGLPHDTVQ